MSREAADIARRAAEIVQERGLAKGEGMDARGRVCFVGALHVAHRERLTRFAYLSEAGLDIDTIHGHIDLDRVTYRDVMAWSDAPETTEVDVAKKLLELADRLEVAS